MRIIFHFSIEKQLKLPDNNVFWRNMIKLKYLHSQEEEVKWSHDLDFVTTGNMNHLNKDVTTIEASGAIVSLKIISFYFNK